MYSYRFSLALTVGKREKRVCAFCKKKVSMPGECSVASVSWLFDCRGRIGEPIREGNNTTLVEAHTSEKIIA